MSLVILHSLGLLLNKVDQVFKLELLHELFIRHGVGVSKIFSINDAVLQLGELANIDDFYL